MTRYRIIANPASRRGAAAQKIPMIEARLKAEHLDFDLVRTERPLHAEDLAFQAAREGVDVVVAAGGDGTSNEVINGLMQARTNGNSGPAIAVLPIGRGNDFSFSLGGPATLEEGFAALVANRQKAIDIGRVTGGDFPEGRYFGNGVGIGFDAVTGFEALKIPINAGFLSYLVAAIRTIFIMKAPLVEIQLDDEHIQQPSLLVSVMNGRRLGGGFWSAPQGIGDDGLFDLCIAGDVSKLQMFMLVPRFLNGTQAGHPAIHITRSRKVTVRALQGVLAAHTDGETLSHGCMELEMEILPRQVNLVVYKNGR
jgi:diacylglycerol kinase (ATP)